VCLFVCVCVVVVDASPNLYQLFFAAGAAANF
jgi:hypothetical protein